MTIKANKRYQHKETGDKVTVMSVRKAGSKADRYFRMYPDDKIVWYVEDGNGRDNQRLEGCEGIHTPWINGFEDEYELID